MKYRLVFLFFILLLLLTGCSKGVDQKDYMLQKYILRDAAVSECNVHGQGYIMHHTDNLLDWNVVCYQDSPFRSFEYPIK